MPDEEKKETGNEDPVSKFAALVERSEKVQKALEESLKKQTELLAIQMMGGTTNNVPKEEKHEETPKEYVKRLLGKK